MRSPITTHILNTHTGLPVEGVLVALYRCNTDQTDILTSAVTNSDGRIEAWDESFDFATGHFRLTFSVADYFTALGQETFFPSITIDFTVEDISLHYHVPLLISGFGYSTYRGS
ncbi:MAG: 5-hydroxyisourate hydrolase [Gammaproteobacteria bacterium]|jgi:5-hydroxyisourate hydrolase